jgi:large subunit ribosomal protein L35
MQKEDIFMPKMKTHRGAAKRFKVLKSGKVKRSKAYKSHLLTHKNAKRKRRLRKATYLVGGDAKNIRRLLPYS